MVVASGTNAFAKEMAIRKRISGIYNKREEDFHSLREYNDYLEEVEDMIVNLVDGVDVPAIEARITEYQRENAEQIMNAQARKAEEYAAALAASKGQLPQTGVDILQSSSSQAGPSGVAQGQYAPAVAGGITQPRPVGPQPVPLGPGLDALGLEYEDEEAMKLRAEKAARAGGWSLEMSKKRALDEAFASIWI
ncbi:cyclin-dependent kinase-activating kinase assembly factor-related / CDK-activating kinase assembly factor-related [Striga hermonthica]|uniref:Cyclin-dependent kinase-activating kinase assembly factor-related / CDK-activating kinase assembly factor-related n=1 Tax=Striga hermonthica TaxID=68872 RepID=A0A9N7NFD8_STRHE|nr:cyclin-dependent kinase-activating kinase assembly factor-related / CDK-activating kinase assembly factor-related [Striga hermonthica]